MSFPNAPHGVVVCEGKDDSAVMSAIASANGVEGLDFREMKGVDKLVGRLEQIKASPAFTSGAVRRLLITRDADDSWTSAFQSLRDAAQRVFDVSIDHPKTWTRASGACEIALWITPGDQKSGMIETLCLQVMRESKPEYFGCLDQFSECLQQNHGGSLHEKEKFAILSLVAQQKIPPRQRLSLERAIKRVEMDWTHPTFSEIAGLLRETAAFQDQSAPTAARPS